MSNTNGLIRVQLGEIKNPKGRGKGSQNRGTIINRWMKAKSKGKNPVTGEDSNLSQQDWIVIAMIGQARKGNVKAAEFLFDNKYGPMLRMADKPVEPETPNPNDGFITFEIVDPHFNDVTQLEIGANQ